MAIKNLTSLFPLIFLSKHINFDALGRLNPDGGGGGPKVPGGFSIGCHFSQDDAMVTKIGDFIHKHLN